MNRELILPNNEKHWLELRLNDITSTDVAALFNCSPYMTYFELWHRKKHKMLADFEANERMKWGNRLQDAIAHGIGEENSWGVRRINEYGRIPELRIGSSFDFEAYYESQDDKGESYLKKHHIEIKNVDSLQFKNGWLIDEDGNIEAPPHIELQVQQEMLVGGYDTNYIGALVGGNDLRLLKRNANGRIHQAIIKKCAEFWYSVDNNIEPKPNFGKDADFISELYDSADGSIISSDDRIDELMIAYKSAHEVLKEMELKKQIVKSEILTLIGEASKVVGFWGSLSTGEIKETFIEAHTRSGYRGFKPYFKKS